MKATKLLAVLIPLVFAAPLAADDDVTMMVVEEGETADRVLAPIELPEAAAEEGVTNSAEGLATANEAREKGREFGEARAAEGRERGEQAREAAAENAENARDRIKDDVARGALENIPDNVRDNIPDNVRDRVPDNVPPRGNGG